MKYRLTDEKREYNGRTLYRIICVKAFGEVKEGELGGWIEKEGNLSQSGNAWVRANAKVCDDAWISGNAIVSGSAVVSGHAKVFGNAKIGGYAIVSDKVHIYGNAEISCRARVVGNAEVFDNVWIGDHARIAGHAWFIDYARIGGNAVVFGNAKIGGYAKVNKNTDFIVFKNHFSSGRYFTWTRSDNMWSVGCFRGTGDELIAKAYQDNEAKGKFYEAYVDFVQRLEIIEEEMEK